MISVVCILKVCGAGGQVLCTFPNMSSLRVRLGKAIRRLRLQAGYSQESFAAVVGVHRTYMGSLERGERNVSLENIEKVAKALNISVSQLFAEAEREL